MKTINTAREPIHPRVKRLDTKAEVSIQVQQVQMQNLKTNRVIVSKSNQPPNGLMMNF